MGDASCATLFKNGLEVHSQDDLKVVRIHCVFAIHERPLDNLLYKVESAEVDDPRNPCWRENLQYVYERCDPGFEGRQLLINFAPFTDLVHKGKCIKLEVVPHYHQIQRRWEVGWEDEDILRVVRSLGSFTPLIMSNSSSRFHAATLLRIQISSGSYPSSIRRSIMLATRSEAQSSRSKAKGSRVPSPLAGRLGIFFFLDHFLCVPFFAKGSELKEGFLTYIASITICRRTSSLCRVISIMVKTTCSSLALPACSCASDSIAISA
jgi:hypothetical protein